MTYDIILFTDLNSKSWHVKSLGAYRIASELRSAGYSVKVLDFSGEWFKPENKLLTVLDKLIGANTLFIGFSGTFFGHAKPSAEDVPASISLRSTMDRVPSPYPCEKRKFDVWCSVFKKKWPHVKLVYGGSTASHTLQLNEFFDYMVIGLADTTVVELASHLKFKTPLKFNFSGNKWKIIDHDVKGLSFKFPTSQTTYVDSDHIFPGEVLALETSRGCMFKCSFCTYPLLGRGKNDPAYKKEIETLAEELKNNWDKFQVNKYFIVDDTFNETTGKIRAIIDAVELANIKLEVFAYIRIDLLEKFPEQIGLLKKLGLRSAYFGIESLNDPSAKAIGKGLSSARVKETLKKCRDEWGDDVAIHTNFIIGLPYETPDTFNEWSTWAIEESPADSIIFNPLYAPMQEQPIVTNQHYHSELTLNPTSFGYIVDNGHWKNEHWDYNQVKKLADEVNQKVFDSGRLKIANWDIMGLMNYGYAFSDLKSKSYRDLDTDLLNIKYFEMFNHYKQTLFKFESIDI